MTNDANVPGIGTPRINAPAKSLDRLLNDLRLEFDDQHCAEIILEIGQLHDAHALPALQNRLLNDKAPTVRNAAAIAMVQIGEPSIWDLFASLVAGPRADADVQVRLNLIDLLSRAGSSDHIVTLVTALQDSQAAVRERAAQALGRAQNPAAIPLLMAGLRGAERRRYAYEANAKIDAHILALVSLGTSVAEPILRSAVEAGMESYLLRDDGTQVDFRTDEQTGVSYFHFYQVRAEVLAHLPGEVIHALANYLHGNTPAPVRMLCVRALAESAESSAAYLLIQMAQHDSDPAIRWTATEGLEHRPVQQVAHALAMILRNDADWRVRRQCARVLGQLRAIEAMDTLCESAVNDPQIQVRQQCLEAVAPMDCAPYTDTLAKIARNERETAIRQVAIQVLSATKHQRAAIALGDVLLDDPDPVLRRLAADGLSTMEAPGISTYLVAALGRDGDANVRSAAATALGKLRDPRALAALKSVADGGDPHPNVRAAAASALAAYSQTPTP